MNAIELYCEIYEKKDGTYENWEKLEVLWSEIRKKHPRLFTSQRGDTNVGAGWWALLEDAFIKIEAVLDANPGLRFETQQIKEKFGGLRFYYMTDSSEAALTNEQHDAAGRQIENIVAEAEALSNYTCEMCGEPGKHARTSWILTLCEKHEAQRLELEK